MAYRGYSLGTFGKTQDRAGNACTRGHIYFCRHHIAGHRSDGSGTGYRYPIGAVDGIAWRNGSRVLQSLATGNPLAAFQVLP